MELKTLEELKEFEELEDYILQYPAHHDISVNKDFFDHDVLQQFKSVWADDDGQIANYRKLIKRNDSGLHIKEYEDHYKIHWDKFNPATHLIHHLVYDAPHYIPVIVGVVGIAGVVIYGLFKK